MSKVRFYLKNPTTNKNFTGEQHIFLNFFYNQKRLRYYTGQKILPKFWNDDKLRAKETKQFPQYPDLNAMLDNLAHETMNIYRRFLNSGKVPSLVQFKDELDAFTNKAIIAGETTLFGFIGQFIDERSRLPKFSPNTIKTYRTTFNHLKAFADKKRRNLDFPDIDFDFFQDFQQYLYSSDNNFQQNSASKLVSVLKTMLTEATERGINKNAAFKSRRFSISRTEVENIYLTIEELTMLYHLDLAGNSKLDRVRDLFIIGAFTGLRFSDFTNVKPENIRKVEGVQVIQITTQKTGEPVTVPVHPFVKAILEKYDGRTPKPLSNQKMNDYLKELAELAKLGEAVILSKNRGGRRFDRHFKKHELVTTHTARRSFATNAFKAGIPAISIMKITGHRTEAAFMKYIKITKEENAILISQNSFFQTSPLRAVK